MRATLRKRCLRFFNSETLWCEIESAYGAPHRAYHTLAHLAQMFEILDQRAEANLYADAINLAVWFHDFCYDTDAERYRLNEFKSVDAMLSIIGRLVPPERRSAFVNEGSLLLAREFILSTVGHHPTAGCGNWPGAVLACELFLDADLAILAGSWEQVEDYDAAIVREFSPGHKPAPMFSRKRFDALSSFYVRDRIFLSPEFADLESPARHNLSLLLDRWKGVSTGQSG